MYKTIDVLDFLEVVDTSFPTPLSKKQNLSDFAAKLSENGTILVKTDGDKIVAMAAGYTENLIENRAYLSVVATLPEYRGRGLASELVKKFIDICRSKNIDAVHLYAVPENTAAIKMYQKIGFEEWKMENEPRKEDAHLIYYLSYK